MSIQEFLDLFGKWLCREPVTIDGESYWLEGYPKLAGRRQINKVSRENSYGTEPQENGVQDWVIPISVEYTNYIKA